MSSIWKDLLFLHGHITHIDPAWRPDTHNDAGGHKAAGKATAKKIKPIAAMCCASVWPRLVQPR